MKKKLLALICCLALAMFALAACSSGSDSSKAVQSSSTAVSETGDTEDVLADVVSGTVITDVDMSSYPEGDTVRLWIPVASDNKYQTITDVVYNASDATDSGLETDAKGNRMYYVEWDSSVAPADRVADVSFHVTRDEVLRPELVEEGTVDEAVESDAELKQYLEPSSSVKIDGIVKERADEITEGQTTVLGKAEAIYDWVVANMNRDNNVTGCGTGDVETLLTDTMAGKCTDINSVFVALCRAAGIPAREMFGVRMNADDITGAQHCWAEFYLPGTGWVGADPADVLKAVLNNDWDKDSEETKELQDYYFGNADAQRVQLSAGRDLVLEPAQAGEPLNNFGYPYAEVNGEEVDCYDAESFSYKITFVEDEVNSTK